MTRTAGTVLAADDDSEMRSLYRCWLVAADEVRTAADGVEALAETDERVDVVLLDREMPRRDGVAVARELERREDGPAVVMISGVEPSVDLLDIPVDDYLQKPVTRATVCDRLQRALAAAGQPRPRRHLLSLATRRRIVDEAASTATLASEPTYQRAVDTLERHSDTLRSARHAVAVERHGRGTEPTVERSLRESP